MKLERGFSLVELLIAMAIGLVIALAISQVYMSGLMTQRTQSDATRLYESGRFAFDLISREIRMSGFSNAWQAGSVAKSFCSTNTNPGPGFFPLNDPSAINPAASSANMLAQTPLTSIYSPASGRYSDVLRIAYYGENQTAALTATNVTAPVLDCHGYAVAANQLVHETLFVAPDPNNSNEPTLFCYTDNPTPAISTSSYNHPGAVAMVAGVESLQLLYGQDTNDAGIINRYLPANKLTDSGATSDQVRSVKVSIVVRSPNAVAPVNATQGPLFHFSSNYPATTNADPSAIFPSSGVNLPADGRLRLLLSTEVNLRNDGGCE